MLRSIIMFLKQLFTSVIFSTESLNKLRLIVKHNALKLPVFPSSVEIFQNIGEFVKKYFTDHRTCNTIQLFVATDGNFSVEFFF